MTLRRSVLAWSVQEPSLLKEASPRKLIKCDCGKSFPFNPQKHKSDSKIYCPRCRREHVNPEKAWMFWRPNLSWIQRKVEQYQANREATKFLDRYFPKNPDGIRAFSLKQWQQGRRPKLSSATVMFALGKNPSQAEIDYEVAWLDKLGVKVAQ